MTLNQIIEALKKVYYDKNLPFEYRKIAFKYLADTVPSQRDKAWETACETFLEDTRKTVTRDFR